MSANVSPGLYSSVFDFSQYAPVIATTTFCVVGGATKGPVGRPGLYSNEGALVADYGPPVLNDMALQAAIQFLQQGSRLVFSRVAHSAVVANITVPGTAGATPAIPATATLSFAGAANPADGDLVTIWNEVPLLAIQNNAVGTVGNQAITLSGSGVSGRIAVSGLSGGSVSKAATGAIKFLNSVNPVAGDTITISDGATSNPFEFVASSPTGTEVLIGANAYASMTNLIAAINAAGFNVAAVSSNTNVIFEMDSNGHITAPHIGVLIGTNAAATNANLIVAINNAGAGATSANDTNTVPEQLLTATALGTLGNMLLQVTGSVLTATNFTGGTDAIPGSSTNVLIIDALTPGSWGNGLEVIVQPTAQLGAPDGNIDLQVLSNVSGSYVVVESFNNLSTTPTDPRWIESIVADGKLGEVHPSQYISIDVLANGGDPTTGTYTLGEGGGTVGTDGISGLVDADYVGNINSPTGLYTVRDPSKVEFNVLAVPGKYSNTIIQAMFTLQAFRNDCFVIVDPPIGLTVQEIVDWHNGTSDIVSGAPTQPLDNPYGALYWAWVLQTDNYSGATIFMPPSGFVAGVYAFSDLTAGVQYAPAGDVRGVVTALGVEYSPDQDDRDLMNGYPNVVNPIVVSGAGLVIYGESTLQRAATARNQVHISRMLLAIMKQVATTVKYLVFDPNNPNTWTKFIGLVTPILEAYAQNNGLESYDVLCDASTNPPAQRSQKIMRGIISLVGVDAAWQIRLAYNLEASGTVFNMSNASAAA